MGASPRSVDTTAFVLDFIVATDLLPTGAMHYAGNRSTAGYTNDRCQALNGRTVADACVGSTCFLYRRTGSYTSGD